MVGRFFVRRGRPAPEPAGGRGPCLGLGCPCPSRPRPVARAPASSLGGRLRRGPPPGPLAVGASPRPSRTGSRAASLAYLWPCSFAASHPHRLATSQPRGLAASNPLTAGGLAASFRQCRETLGDIKSQREGSGGPGGATTQRRNAQQHCAEQIMIMAGIASRRSFGSQKSRARTSLLLQPYGLTPYAVPLCCGCVASRRLCSCAALFAAVFL